MDERINSNTEEDDDDAWPLYTVNSQTPTPQSKPIIGVPGRKLVCSPFRVTWAASTGAFAILHPCKTCASTTNDQFDNPLVMQNMRRRTSTTCRTPSGSPQRTGPRKKDLDGAGPLRTTARDMLVSSFLSFTFLVLLCNWTVVTLLLFELEYTEHIIK